MTTQLELQAAKVAIGLSGQIGTKVVYPIDNDRIVTTTNMKVGAYTIAAQPTAPSQLTVTVTAVGAADTMGTINFIGTLPGGTIVHEKVTPIAGQVVSTVNEFDTVTSATGAGWVIGEGNDTITIGVGSVVPNSFYFNAIDNRIVASANMKVGAYTVAAQPLTPSKITVLATAAGATDTLGTIAIFGLVDGEATIETVTPVAGTTVTTTNTFSHIYSVTGAGWVISEGNDTIKVGTAEVSTASQYYFCGIQVVSAAVVASQTDKTGSITAQLSDFASLPAGFYPTKVTKIALTSGTAIVYLAQI